MILFDPEKREALIGEYSWIGGERERLDAQEGQWTLDDSDTHRFRLYVV